MDLGISGKRVLIVGGSKGLGGSIAENFHKEGCSITVIARRKEYLDRLKERLGQNNDNSYISSDLLKPGEPTNVINKILTYKNKFDIVVHNIGGALGIKDYFSPSNDWMNVWKFNVGISIEINNILIPKMIDSGWGRVIHMSSVSSIKGEPTSYEFGGSIPYAASKAYINSYVQGLARELASKNVLINAVMPGVVRSEGKYWDKMIVNNPELVENFIERYCSIGRFAMPDEIASFVVFLASQRATYAAGSLVSVDGGMAR